jgi:AraC-like DNA-binding protein
MMKTEIIPRKIKNPWPEQKRRAYLAAIEWDLKTYEAMQTELRDLQADIDELAAPPATDIRGNIYAIPHSRPDTLFPEYLKSHPARPLSDPTPDRAELISEYRARMLCATEYRETVRRLNAIDRLLIRLERSQKPDDRLKLQLLKAKYFDQDKSDQQIADDLHISERTFRNWKNCLLLEIAKQLGMVV